MATRVEDEHALLVRFVAAVERIATAYERQVELAERGTVAAEAALAAQTGLMHQMGDELKQA